MSEPPTSKQALILWCLLGRSGSALQSVIVPKIERADREALIAAHLLEAHKQGRSLRLTVTDEGWNWAGAHLRDPLPPSLRVLQDWLELLHAHLEANAATLAEFIGPMRAETEPVPASKAKVPAKSRSKDPPNSKVARKPKSASGPAPARIRERIEAAYLALTGGERATAVRLSALRAHLADVDRATLDAGLAAILRGDPNARLSQFSDPKSLDAVEREAAYAPAGEPFHILWIQS
ncbi:hypothetical protein [Methylobacterium sp. Leaf100]|uniref:hypothetical protein n=1 Tax=Methylobacterium sp. Leaf100 TaxID=1736252 RepID=UPI0006F4A33C|nr:hypothetical protein [Methylobacterium sp. Leaf100]KQP27474.1 hypothetical protein ASF25_20800 [Methylobacterium sp. Leaf100]